MKNDIPDLRHPMERPIYILTAAFNLFLIIAAAVIFLWSVDLIGLGPLKNYPVLENYSSKARTVVLVFLSLPIIGFFWKRSRRALILGNSVRLSEKQFPELFETMKTYSKRLGLERVPEIYLNHGFDIRMPAGTSMNHDYIMIDTTYLGKGFEENKEALKLLIASRLAMIKLGHTRFWDIFFIFFPLMIPYLSHPLKIVRTYSRDRYGAYLVPEGLRGMLILVLGRHGYKEIDIEDYLEQAGKLNGIWAVLAELYKGEPHLSYRVKTLCDMGLFHKSEVKKDRAA